MQRLTSEIILSLNVLCVLEAAVTVTAHLNQFLYSFVSLSRQSRHHSLPGKVGWLQAYLQSVILPAPYTQYLTAYSSTLASILAMSDASTSSPSPGESAVVYLPIGAAAIEACGVVGYEAFARFSSSVAQPPYFSSPVIYRDSILAELDKPTTFHLMAVRPHADSGADNFVAGVGQVLGSVIMDCADEAAAIGPISVSSSTQSRGIGRRLMELCLVEAARRHFSSVRLCNIVANITAFSLYHSLGFRAREYTVAVRGHIGASQQKQLSGEMEAEGVSVRPMRQEDIAACNQLHVATNSFSRLATIAHSFHTQLSQRTLLGDTKGSTRDEGNGDGYQQPSECCLVAVDRDGNVIGYCDGYDVDSHLSATTAQSRTQKVYSARSVCS